MNTLNIWIMWFKQTLLEKMAYPTDFLLRIIGIVIFVLVSPICAYLIYSSTLGLPGWSFEQLLLFQGILATFIGINSAFIGGISWQTSDMVRKGNFDLVMIAPYRVLTFLICTVSNAESLAEIGTGLVISAYALLKLNLAFNLTSVIAFFAVFGLALLFLFSINILVAALSFFVVKSYALTQIFNNIMSLSEYPLTIYGPIGIFLFTFIFPIGLAAFYPAQALLGVLSFQKIFELALVAFTFFGISLILWSVGLKHYSSAGG